MLFRSGDILARTRAIVGPKVPIGCELDLHCHLTQQMIDAATAIVAMSETPAVDPAVNVPFLAGYTDFLIAAGDANIGYVEAGGQELADMLGPNDLSPLARASLALEADVHAPAPANGDLAAEVARSADALSYYIASASLVTSYQAFGMSGFGLGEDPTVGDEAAIVDASVEAAAGTVDAVAAVLQDRGIDPGYSDWSASWGAAIAAELAGTPRAAAGAVLGLNELWYDAITVLMLDAAADEIGR